MGQIRCASIATLAALLVAAPGAALADETGSIDPSLFNAMRWRDIGPYRGGRVLAVEGVSDVPGLFYFGAAAGGVWKTEDNGAHWKPTFDQVPESSIGAIAVAPSNPKVIYVGTGEGELRNSITYGTGVYKSVDGGESWTHIGLLDTRQIGALIVDPRNPDIVLVAAIGHAYGPNAERGVFRSEDGGKSWNKVLYRDENTGAADVAFDPHDPNIVYAALWQVRIQPWGASERGPGGGLFRSKDGGKTWSELTSAGLPKGPLGRIDIAISGADPRRVYALIDAEEGGLYRSDDGGEQWARVSQDVRIRYRPLYFGKIYADPKSADTIYIANTTLYRSKDGGKSFDPVSATGWDHHGVWIDPADPRRIIEASDAGASVSLDEGQTWSTYDNQPIGQIYHLAVDNRFPFWVYGTQQDFNSIAIASDSGEKAIGARSWYPAGGGEAGFIAPDPRDPMIVYSASSGAIGRFDNRMQQFQDISPWPLPNNADPSLSTDARQDLATVIGTGAAAFLGSVGKAPHRFNWNAPVMLSAHDPDLLYAAAEVVLKSANHGNSWTIMSPDLTGAEKSKQGARHGAISALAESPLNKGLLWAGSDDGRVHLTRDGGGHWTDVTPKGVLEGGKVSTIEPSPFNPEIAYLTLDRHELDDIKAYAFKTNDVGKSWTPITNGLPEGAFVRAIREDPKRPGLLYAATERGVFVSFNGGAHWQPLQLNLPATPVHDLVVKGDDLVAATHGRGFWILDDLTPLRQITTETGSHEVVLFAPQTAFRVPPSGVSRHSGAVIDYVFRTEPKGEITLDILNGEGEIIRHLSSIETVTEEGTSFYSSENASRGKISAEAGMNREAWDLHSNDPLQVPGAVYSAGWYSDNARGVLVAPGRYTVRLTVDGKRYEQPLTLVADPRSGSADAAIDAKVTLETLVVNDIERLHKAIIELRKLRETSKQEHLASRLATLAKEMDRLDQILVGVNTKARGSQLGSPVELEGGTPPTEQQQRDVEALHGKIEAVLAAWASLKGGQGRSVRD